MRDYDTATSEYLQAREAIVARHLLWVTAFNLNTSSLESLGLWSGDDTQVITVEGEARTYYGAAGVLDIPPIQASIGTDVRYLDVGLAHLNAQVHDLLRGYDIRLAPVQVHRALFHAHTRALVSTPVRIWDGWINSVRLPTAAIGGEDSASVRVASAARALTRNLALFRSNAAMQARQIGDTFRRYSDISDDVGVWWGEKREAPFSTTQRRTEPFG